MAYIIPNPYMELTQEERLERMYGMLDRNCSNEGRERIKDELETLAVAIARGYGWSCTE